MTRNFKQHGRDDERSYPRHYSNRHEGEQSPRPARPRLNRASVDRAWENGARQQHPDYHPRGERPTRNDRPRQQGQSYPANRRQSAPDDASSTPHTRSYRQPPFQRRENRQFDDRTQRRYDDRQPRSYERSRSFEPGQGERAPGDRTYHERPRYTRNDDRRAPYQERRPSYRDQERDPYSGPRPARRYDARNDEQRGTGGSHRYSRSYEQERGYRRDDRRSETGRETGPGRNPRFESRPERFARSNYTTHGAGEEELFEGDYEHFDSQHRQGRAPQDEEPHVTRLPDGRVLRGSRKEQREAAAFWTDVDQETGELVSGLGSDDIDQPQEKPARAERTTTRSTPKKESGAPRKPGRHKEAKAPARRTESARGESRAKKTSAKSKSSKSAGSATRPSQRGYKWPESQ